MEGLTIKELAPYLPYGLKVQYKGIINRKELSKHSKIEPKFNDSNDFLKVSPEWEKWEKNKPKEVIGDRISEIKQIRFFKEYITFHVGTYHNYLKTVFYDDFKPILRPLSDLTKEIEVNGERFIPMEILVKIEDLFFKEIIEIKSNCTGNIFWADYYTEDDDKKRFCYCINSFQIGHLEPNKHSFIRAGYELYEKLFEWHFDVFGLLEKGLAIDINTIK